jgi:hypothetical protein
MGTVYRARDLKFGHDVVIKAPRPALLDDPDFAGRFERDSLPAERYPHTFQSSPLAITQPSVRVLRIFRRQPDRHRTGEWLDPTPATRSTRAAGWRSPRPSTSSTPRLHPPRRQTRQHPLRRRRASWTSASPALAGTDAPPTSGRAWVGDRHGPVHGPELIHGKGCDGRIDQYALAVSVRTVERHIRRRRPAAIAAKQVTAAAPPLQAAVAGPRRLSRGSPGLPEPRPAIPRSRRFARGLADVPPRPGRTAAIAAPYRPGGRGWRPRAGTATDGRAGESVSIARPECGELPGAEA